MKNDYSARVTPFLIPLLFAGAMIYSACDSGGPNVEVSEIDGDYEFTEFRFLPDASALPAVNVLDTLTDNTASLSLSSNRRFTLRYRFQEADGSNFIDGSFDPAEDDRIQLNVSEETRAEADDVLLPGSFRLDIVEDGARLEGEFADRVDLAAFSESYAGIPPVEGRVILRLQRQ